MAAGQIQLPTHLGLGARALFAAGVAVVTGIAWFEADITALLLALGSFGRTTAQSAPERFFAVWRSIVPVISLALVVVLLVGNRHARTLAFVWLGALAIMTVNEALLPVRYDFALTMPVLPLIAAGILTFWIYRVAPRAA